MHVIVAALSCRRPAETDPAPPGSRLTVRPQAHTGAGAAARHGTDSGIIAGTAGAPAMERRHGTTHGSHDPDFVASGGQTFVSQRESELRSSATARRSSAVSVFKKHRDPFLTTFSKPFPLSLDRAR